jgi:hypothetical protein
VNGRILPYPMTPVEAQGGSSNSQGGSGSSIREAPGRQQQLGEEAAAQRAARVEGGDGKQSRGGNGHREVESGGGDGDGRREGDSGALVMAALR